MDRTLTLSKPSSVTMRLFAKLVVLLLVASAVSAWRARGNTLNRALHGSLQLQKTAQKENYLEPQAQWFEQNVDHFDEQFSDLWKQKYYTNHTYFKESGPGFLEIGGEGPISPGYVDGGLFINELAQDHDALILALEHRFYGDSFPFNDTSTKSLRYLSSQQGLADVALFIQEKSKEFKISKWIVFGGSYPGNLAAWFRIKYPNLALAAVASSAPVRAELDFTEYQQVVGDSLLADGGEECVDAVAKASQQIDSLLDSQAGRDQLKDLFTLCEPLTSAQGHDVATFAETIMGWLDGVVQYNPKYMQWSIGDVCKVMTATGDPLRDYATLSNDFLEASGEHCLDASYNNMIQEMRDTTIGPQSAGRCWTYQTCVEFGYYQTTNSKAQPFGDRVPLSYYIDICQDAFDFDAPLNVNWTNTYYGGQHPAGSRILFPNGSIDPWHALGITKDVSESEKALFIEGTSHCADMGVHTPGENPHLAPARAVVRQQVTDWLNSS